MNNKNKLRLIILEKNDKESKITISLLKKSNINFQIKSIRDSKTYNQQLLEFPPDIIISNYYLKDSTAFEALLTAK